MFGSFFGIVQKFFGKPAIVLHINSSRSSSRNRTDRRDPFAVAQFLSHQDFRRSADNEMVSEVVVVHIRRRIETSQRPVQGNRTFGKAALNALTNLHLHTVAGQNVVLGLPHSLQIIFSVKRTLGFVNDATGSIRSFYRSSQCLFETSNTTNGCRVCPWNTWISINNDVHTTFKTVDHNEFFAQQQTDIRHPDTSGLIAPQFAAFDHSNRVIAEVPDQSARQAWQPLRQGNTKAFDKSLHKVKGICFGVAFGLFSVSQNLSAKTRICQMTDDLYVSL